MRAAASPLTGHLTSAQAGKVGSQRYSLAARLPRDTPEPGRDPLPYHEFSRHARHCSPRLGGRPIGAGVPEVAQMRRRCTAHIRQGSDAPCPVVHAQAGRPGTAAGGHHDAPGSVPSLILVFMALRSGASALLSWTVKRGVELAFAVPAGHQDCQAMAPFDRSPSPVPSREVYERSTAGTSQVSKAGGNWRGTGQPGARLSVTDRCILQPTRRPAVAACSLS